MVSKASDDLPEPLGPVTTTSRSRGRLTVMFCRLCWRAPRTTSKPVRGAARPGPSAMLCRRFGARQREREVQRGQHPLVLGFALLRGVVGDPVVDAGAQEREPPGRVYGGAPVEQL